MGLTKSDKFSKEQNQLAQVFKALGHPARIAILQTLIKRNVCVCGDIVEELPLSQSTTSQHLAELKKAGLIRGSVSGPTVCYCIDNDNWVKMKIDVDELMNLVDPTKVSC